MRKILAANAYAEQKTIWRFFIMYILYADGKY